MLNRILFVLLLLVAARSAHTQTVAQPNINFEEGNTSHWAYYIGSCCPLSTTIATGATPNRHVLTSGSGLDPYGHFPVVCPDGGSYSLKLGNDNTGSEAERASYTVHVPANDLNYYLLFRFAVVFQDPGHDSASQPRFVVSTYDSVTSSPINCAQYVYVASPDIPGFHYSDVDSSVLFRDWTAATIDLAGYNGKTVVVDFSTGDCAWGAHFGYGYLDLNTWIFPKVVGECNGDSALLQGPFGFEKYYWYEGGGLLVDTVQFMKVKPPLPASYTLVLQPYPGFGCPDTLQASLAASEISIHPADDISACANVSFALAAHVDGGVGKLTYAWTPAVLDCGDCTAVQAVAEANARYIIQVTDSVNCVVSDTINVHVDTCMLTIPNAFTPNGDGLNDIFRVIGVGFKYYEEFSFGVYNRFGERVFYTQDIYSGWDGTYKGVPQDLGVFFYMARFKLNGERYMLKGDVTLVR